MKKAIVLIMLGSCLFLNFSSRDDNAYNIYMTFTTWGAVNADLFGSNDGGSTWFLMGSQSNFAQPNNFIFKAVFSPIGANCPNGVKLHMTTPAGTVNSSSSWTTLACGSTLTLVQSTSSYISSNKTIAISYEMEP